MKWTQQGQLPFWLAIPVGIIAVVVAMGLVVGAIFGLIVACSSWLGFGTLAVLVATGAVIIEKLPRWRLGGPPEPPKGGLPY